MHSESISGIAGKISIYVYYWDNVYLFKKNEPLKFKNFEKFLFKN